MDKTLLPLLVLSVILVTILAPHATLTLAAVVGLSVIVTRSSWAILQSFGQAGSQQRAID